MPDVAEIPLRSYPYEEPTSVVIRVCIFESLSHFPTKIQTRSVLSLGWANHDLRDEALPCRIDGCQWLAPFPESQRPSIIRSAECEIPFDSIAIGDEPNQVFVQWSSGANRSRYLSCCRSMLFVNEYANAHVVSISSGSLLSAFPVALSITDLRLET